MTRIAKKLLSPSVFIALAALFVALGVPGYAANGARSLFVKQAANADKVDGFHASAKPRSLSGSIASTSPSHPPT